MCRSARSTAPAPFLVDVWHSAVPCAFCWSMAAGQTGGSPTPSRPPARRRWQAALPSESAGGSDAQATPAVSGAAIAPARLEGTDGALQQRVAAASRQTPGMDRGRGRRTAVRPDRADHRGSRGILKSQYVLKTEVWPIRSLWSCNTIAETTRQVLQLK
jgi:hypothetical protein